MRLLKTEEITPSENGKTLNELRLKNNETLHVISKNEKIIPRGKLLTEEG